MDTIVKNVMTGISLLTGEPLVVYDCVGELEVCPQDEGNPMRSEQSGEFVEVPSVAEDRLPLLCPSQ